MSTIPAADCDSQTATKPLAKQGARTISVWLNLVVFGTFFLLLGVLSLASLLVCAIMVFPVPRIEAHFNTSYAAGFQQENWARVEQGMPLESARALLGEPSKRWPAVTHGAPQSPEDEWWSYSKPAKDGGWFCYRLRVDVARGTVTERTCLLDRRD